MLVFFKTTRLKKAALKTISQVKKSSFSFVENNIKNIDYVELDIDIKPIYFVIPHNGIFTEYNFDLFLSYHS